MRKALLTLLVLVATFVAGGVTALAVVPRDAAPASQPGSTEPVTLPTSTADVPTAGATTSTPAPTTTSPESPPVSPSTPPSTQPSEPACSLSTPLVDSQATPEATCLAAKLDSWQSTGKYGAGQELNLSTQDFKAPLRRLEPQQPAVVGFDLQELQDGENYGFASSPLDELLKLNQGGTLLTASWHMQNPHTNGNAFDRSWQDLHSLLDVQSKDGKKFWDDFDQKMELLDVLQSGDNGLYPPAAVLFRPMHEANGNWFWWAQGTDPSDYKALYAMMQQRAASDGVHNIVWGWSFNAVSSSNVVDPAPIRPDKVDLVGIDTYEQMAGRGTPDEQMNLSGLSEMAGSAPRIAVTEAGPLGSKDGNWDPRSVARAAVAQGLKPSYLLLWFDDGNGDDGNTGKKQISSLQQGPGWLKSCPGGVCSLS